MAAAKYLAFGAKSPVEMLLLIQSVFRFQTCHWTVRTRAPPVPGPNLAITIPIRRDRDPTATGTVAPPDRGPETLARTGLEVQK